MQKLGLVHSSGDRGLGRALKASTTSRRGGARVWNVFVANVRSPDWVIAQL
jgi:hypothetical protein